MTRTAVKRHIEGLPKSLRLPFLISFVGFFTLDQSLRQLIVDHTHLRLSRIETLLFWHLSYPIGRIISSDTFSSCIMADADSDANPARAMSAVIKMLRPKLAPCGLEIVSHWGVGFSLVDHGNFQFPWPSRFDPSKANEARRMNKCSLQGL